MSANAQHAQVKLCKLTFSLKPDASVLMSPAERWMDVHMSVSSEALSLLALTLGLLTLR